MAAAIGLRRRARRAKRSVNAHSPTAFVRFPHEKSMKAIGTMPARKVAQAAAIRSRVAVQTTRPITRMREASSSCVPIVSRSARLRTKGAKGAKSRYAPGG